MRLFNLLVFLLFVSPVVYSQSIEGYVFDEETGKPVQFANVFLANTSIGSVTDDKGYFLIKKVPYGKYDLTASFIGYTTFSEVIEIASDQRIKKRITLKSELVELPEVFVMADTSEWKKNFEVFKANFLGVNPYAKEVKILNPRDIYLYFDHTNSALFAHAKKDIVIENQHLGYKIYYNLYSFEANFKNGRITYYGIPRFEMLEGGKRKQKRWAKNREEVFNGSKLQLIRALYQGTLNGFDVTQLFKVRNPNRPPDEIIKQKISHYRSKLVEAGKPVSIGINSSGNMFSDSLNYYLRKKRLPEYLDSLGYNYMSARELKQESDTSVIQYQGILQVVYKEAKEHQAYPNKRVNGRLSWQHSQWYINEPIRIYENGYFDPVQAVFTQGYWSWSETMATLLPLDYKTEDSK